MPKVGIGIPQDGAGDVATIVSRRADIDLHDAQQRVLKVRREPGGIECANRASS
nr:hypothetical protein [Mesorhizobium sp. ES1-4]